jgi:uncharacterized membrane protein
MSWSTSRGLLAGLVAAQVGYGRLPERRRVGATRAIVGLMLATSLAEAIEARGLRRGAGPIAAAGTLGLAAEHVGVRTGRPFGAYHYSDKLGPRIGGVPVLAAAAWAMMARPAWAVAGRIAGNDERRLRVALAAGALTAWDVFLDPRMAREGYWTWHGAGRYEGVPASNFLGWFLTGLGVFAVWSLIDDGEGDEDSGAVALYAWTWIGETFANAVLWRRPVTATAGALAMGAFALPSLHPRGQTPCLQRRARRVQTRGRTPFLHR